MLVASDPELKALASAVASIAEQSREIWLFSPESGKLVLPALVGPDAESGPTSEPLQGETLTALLWHAMAACSPADVVLLSEPCVVAEAWLECLRAAAYADTNNATASALTTEGSSLALCEPGHLPRDQDMTRLVDETSRHALRLHPRLNRAVDPCIFIRRDALQLVGGLDATSPYLEALADFSRRCLQSGLAHVAADDLIVQPLSTDATGDARPSDGSPRDRAYAGDKCGLAASPALTRALQAARRPISRLSLTIDVRALVNGLTGTQRHIAELAGALANTGQLRLRLLVSPDIGDAYRELLGSLPETELLSADAVDLSTPKTTIFHRPQQVFGPSDLRLAVQLGERVVVSQLDLIAYRNPTYHADALAWRSYRRVSRQALALADRVVVFSEHTRLELLSDELAEDDRIAIVPPGLDHPFTSDLSGTSEEDVDVHASAQTGGSGFLLCLGTDFHHKNRLFALRMLDALRERHGWPGRLIFAGTHVEHGSSSNEERHYLQDNPQLADAVVELGPLAEGVKERLMREATALVYPSVYEGFGLVPFEAALAGVPCIFAAQASLANVTPTGTATIEPWDPATSADRAISLLSSGESRDRHVAQLAGVASGLTWQATAATMIDVFEQARTSRTREAAVLSRDEIAREAELQQLVAAHAAHLHAVETQLTAEREHARAMYERLNAEVGFSLSLIGPNGALPEDVQRALLALSARPSLSRPLYGAAAMAFRATRGLKRGTRRSGIRDDTVPRGGAE